jgi:uncharacterized protein YbgA (DUF1722 family)
MTKHKNNQCLKCENMNLKNWKQFSDEVDEYNKKLVDAVNKKINAGDFSNLLELFVQGKIEKTIENFLEWECGKLVIKTAPL